VTSGLTLTLTVATRHKLSQYTSNVASSSTWNGLRMVFGTNPVSREWFLTFHQFLLLSITWNKHQHMYPLPSSEYRLFDRAHFMRQRHHRRAEVAVYHVWHALSTNHSFTCHPSVYPRTEWTQPQLVLLRDERLGWLQRRVRFCTHRKTVTHPSTNRAWRWLTLNRPTR